MCEMGFGVYDEPNWFLSTEPNGSNLGGTTVLLLRRNLRGGELETTECSASK
jgi:hypothetical protein